MSHVNEVILLVFCVGYLRLWLELSL